MAKLYGVSLFTLAVLMVMVGGLLGVGLQGQLNLSMEMVFAITIGFTALMWLVSPYLIDLTQRMFYSTRFLSFKEFSVLDKNQAAFIRTVCERHGLSLPSIRLIEDQNPTAFCYGSASWNARVAISSGLFHYCSADEAKAVIAHELGHIRNMDFLVMSIGSCLVTMLYEIYFVFRSGKKTRALGLVAYVMYGIGTYLLLWLSRTREYLADQFSARETGDPNLLASALVKIAYGIAAEPDTEASKRLLASTRALGVYDFKHADAVGMSYKGLATIEGSATEAKKAEHVMLFDVFSPWATVVELGSTHPLTGKRIKALSVIAEELGKQPKYDFELVRLEGGELDRTRLYGNFAFDLSMYFAPVLGGLAGVGLGSVGAAGFHWALAIGGGLAGWGLGTIGQAMVCYPSLHDPRQTTVLDLMCDPYASPLRGQYVTLNGTVVGRSVAGSKLSEDMVLQDTSGSIINMNYRSWLPLLGDLFFGIKRVKALISQNVVATGWFHRSLMGVIDLRSISGLDKQFSSYPRMWQFLWGGLLVVSGVLAAATSAWGGSIF